MKKPVLLSAFTLAEVLITIAVIGVVASLTIPTIIQKIQYQGYVAKFKKVYSALQQATVMIENETGVSAKDFDVSCNSTSGDQKCQDMANLYAKYLKATSIATKSYIWDSPYLEKNYKLLNGTSTDRGIFIGYVSVIPDGTIISYGFKSLSNTYSWDTHCAGASMRFTIDVNGRKKPNQVGRDIFRLYLSTNGKIIAPQKYQDALPPYREDCDPNGEGMYGYGYSCAYKIITEGKMNY